MSDVKLSETDKGFESLEVNDYKIFLHGNTETQPGNRRGSGGVTIFLNKRAHDAWTKVGQPTPMLGGKVGNYSCLIGIHLHFKIDKLIHKLFVVSSYHPHIGKNTEIINNFYEILDDFIANVPLNYTVIMGCDINTSIGITETKHDQEISGKFRIQQRRNDICENHMHNFMHTNDLRSTTTCFQHTRYDTWTHPNPTLEV